MPQSYLTANNFSYWDPSHPSAPHWNYNGAEVAPGVSNTPNVTPATVSAASFTAGNAICNTLFLDVENSAENRVYTRYVINIVPAGVQPAFDASVDPQDVVNEAMRFASVIKNVSNDVDCGWITDAVGGAAGAGLPSLDQSIIPTENREGGFWRIIHRGTDNPLADWQSLVQPGDIVRMDWADPKQSQHTSMMLSTQAADGSVLVYDNGLWSPSLNHFTIGAHRANFDIATNPASVTIYRLASDHRYLMEGTQPRRNASWNDLQRRYSHSGW